MGEYNPDEWTTVALKKVTIEKLDKLKIHPKQNFDEVVNNLLNERGE